MTTPDPQTLAEVDPREELPMLQPTTTIYDAYIENQPGWDGEGLYADLETAKRYSAAEYVLEAWGTDSTGPLTWRFEHGFWDLLDDGRATGVIVAPREVVGAQPDEQPTAEQDGAADNLYWPFTGALDTCYMEHHEDGDGYRECCLRAGLAYALPLHEQQVRASVAAEQDGDVRAVAACCSAAETFEHDADCETRDADGSAS
ncbi:MAG: hypothetical protein YHS30scaffold324_24 [Catenulispora phage 69_17]|jgi:hypothetical protein|nr:MAG: hypothetical protein YHS30scaffold324_24 [Catenulispora phage 69_17]